MLLLSFVLLMLSIGVGVAMQKEEGEGADGSHSFALVSLVLLWTKQTLLPLKSKETTCCEWLEENCLNATA